MNQLNRNADAPAFSRWAADSFALAGKRIDLAEEVLAQARPLAGLPKTRISRECTIWDCSAEHPFYSVLHNNRQVTVKGKQEPVQAYLLGNWPAPFGIVLVLDRLAALMLLLTSVLAAASTRATTPT